MILLWSGTIATIPAGYVLCDGNNGTPDLRDRFTVCAKQDDAGSAKTNLTGALTISGGNKDHNHAFTGDGHAHDPGETVDTAGSGPSEAWDDVASDPANAAGTTDANSGQPPYYALAYIMKT